MGILDDLPSWLRIFNIIDNQDDDEGSVLRKS